MLRLVTQNQPMQPKRFHSLDGLRGVCALSVMLFHAADLFRPGPLMAHGFLAVDMFFLLSGFVIALNYEQALQSGLQMTVFLRARANRLLPVYWLGAVFNVAVFVWMASSGFYPPGFTPMMIWFLVPLLTFLMMPVYGVPGGGFSPAMMNVSWSLLVEWLVNILYAARLCRLRTRSLALIVVIGWFAMAVAGYFTTRGWCVGISRDDVFTYGLMRGFPDFLAGVVIFRLYKSGVLARLPAISTELLLTVWLCIAVVPTFTATPTFDAMVVILICPLLVMLLIRSDAEAPAFTRTLGALSYPLYVVHPGIILLAQGTPLFGLDRHPDPLRAALVILSCLAAAGTVLWLSNLRKSWPRTAVTPVT
jgi:peptidoglycan/LPS O-acetylase OafA/YrhL